MGEGDGIEKVDGCVPYGMVAVNVEEMAAVEGRLIGIDGGAARTQVRSRCADVGGRGGGVKGQTEGHGVFEGGAEGVPAVESPTRSAEPATRALEDGVLSPDSTGLESSLVETADKGVRPALLDETTRGAGSDCPAAGCEVGSGHSDALPKGQSSQRGRHEASWSHPAEKKVELHTGFLELTHCRRFPPRDQRIVECRKEEATG